MINGFVGAFVSNISENFANLASGHVFIQGVEKSATGKEYDIIHDDAALLEAVQQTAKAVGIQAKYISKRSSFQGALVFAGKNAQLRDRRRGLAQRKLPARSGSSLPRAAWRA
jgi:hypothetical protein